MTQKNEEVPPGSHSLLSSQQRKRKRRADNNESENTQPCGEASNNITSVPLRKAFTRVLNDISNIPTNLRSSTVSIGTNPANAQSSNQTTVSNSVGGSNNNKATLKRKRSTSIDVTEHTPSSYSSKKKCSKPGVLADITNTLPSMLGTPSTSGSCISKISTKGKGKVVAEDNKLKSNTRTKRCRKTLEQQFDGCVVDYSSCEDDEDQAFQYDYEEESELYKEQVYDCSSEESDTSNNETINCNPISKDSDANQRSPDVLSKEGKQEINTQRTSSCAKMVKRTSSSAQMMKPTSSRKSRGNQNDDFDEPLESPRNKQRMFQAISAPPLHLNSDYMSDLTAKNNKKTWRCLPHSYEKQMELVTWGIYFRQFDKYMRNFEEHVL
ncbi:hypothetical protein YC2023_025347 [Brassica napus]